jgi:putative ABC transport system ATP-binding protein
MKPLISTSNLFKIYQAGDQQMFALNDVSLDIEAGEYLAIMGSSGSGKSTFMNILGLLDVPTKGDYIFNGESVIGKTKTELAHLRRNYLGFVFQSYNLLARTTAFDNVELPLLYGPSMSKSDRKEKVEGALTSVGLADRMHQMPNQLSGGQQQRVAIARAIVNNPKVILADEPTGNLDTRMSMEIVQIFQRLNDEGITIIMITHESDIGLSAKRKVVFKDGKIIEDGPVPERLIAVKVLEKMPVTGPVVVAEKKSV